MNKKTDEQNPFDIINRSNARIRRAFVEVDNAFEEHALILESFCAGINASPTEIHNHTEVVQTEYQVGENVSGS